jgi:peptide/nickel transport system substrate-binding protein
MKKAQVLLTVAVVFGVLSVCTCAYESMPADAKVLPLGEAGTAWEELQLGVRGGRFFMFDLGNPKKWNPLTAVETSTTLYTNHFYHGLITLDPITAKLEPALAKRWEVSDDDRTLIFHLRRGLRWSDGIPFTADDVLFTFNDLILNEDVTTRARDVLRLPDGSFPRIEKLDEHTVRVTLSMVFRPILSALAQKILPRHKLAHLVHKLNPEVETGAFNAALGLDTDPRDIVGMGPYVLDSYVPDQYVVLRRNPYYYVYDSNGVQLPYYDQRVMIIVQSHDVALLKFLNGELDAFAPRISDLPVLMGKAAITGFTVKIDPHVATYGTAWLGFNQDVGLASGTEEAKRALYRTEEFRQAFAQLVDKEAMIDTLFHGLALPQWSPVSFGSPFYAGRDTYGGAVTENDAAVFEYDLDKAAQILDGLGVFDRDGDGWRDDENGDRLSVMLTTVSGMTDYEGECMIVADRARQIGLKVNVVPLEANTVLNDMFGGTFDAILLAFTGGNEPNSLSGVYEPCGRLHFWHGSGCEEPFESELELSALFDAGVATLDNEEAFEIYQQIQIKAALSADLIYTVYPAFRYAYCNHVGNAQMANPNGHPTGHTANAADFIFDCRLVR